MQQVKTLSIPDLRNITLETLIKSVKDAFLNRPDKKKSASHSPGTGQELYDPKKHHGPCPVSIKLQDLMKKQKPKKPLYLLDVHIPISYRERRSGLFLHHNDIAWKGCKDSVLLKIAIKEQLTIITNDKGLVIRACKKGVNVIHQDQKKNRYHIYGSMTRPLGKRLTPDKTGKMAGNSSQSMVKKPLSVLPNCLGVKSKGHLFSALVKGMKMMGGAFLHPPVMVVYLYRYKKCQ